MERGRGWLFCVGDARGGQGGSGVGMVLAGVSFVPWFFPRGGGGRFDAVSIHLMDGAEKRRGEERKGASFFLSLFLLHVWVVIGRRDYANACCV